MKTKLGTFFMLAGAALIAASLLLFLSNEQEQLQAGEAIDTIMPQIVEAINTRVEVPPETEPLPVLPILPEPKEMTVVEIDGYGYVGFLNIPALNLELPVMADWSYPQLRISPCRYTGATHTDDLVIMAHNYDRHFGRLKDLRAGDVLTFIDMDGATTEYEVVALDVLAPTDIEEMTAGDYDLTLFTCTYGGENRVTIRCDRRSA